MDQTLCPLCGIPMWEYRDVMDGWCTCEHHLQCRDGCQLYSFEFSYGSHRLYVNGLEFEWHHTTPLPERRLIRAIELQVIENTRYMGA